MGSSGLTRMALGWFLEDLQEPRQVRREERRGGEGRNVVFHVRLQPCLHGCVHCVPEAEGLTLPTGLQFVVLVRARTCFSSLWGAAGFPLHWTPRGGVLKNGDLTDGFPSGVPRLATGSALTLAPVHGSVGAAVGPRVASGSLGSFRPIPAGPGAPVAARAQEAPAAAPAARFRPLLPSALQGWRLASASGSAAAGLVPLLLLRSGWGLGQEMGEKGTRVTREKKT